jgi:gluconate 5-dehydrogenase
LDLFKLDGRRALVTGAVAGLGRQFARSLAEAGAHALCAGIDGEGADAADRKICADGGGEATGVEIDVSDEESVLNAANEIVANGRR